MSCIQPFRELRIESVCDSCGEAIFSGDIAFALGGTVYCADCVTYSRFIAGGESARDDEEPLNLAGLDIPEIR